ncbi:MAG: amidohydrolase family protein [Gaiellaceae bacterium]
MASHDLHQHLWPERFVTALRSRTTPPLLAGDELVTHEGRFPVELAAHEPATRIRALDRDGIDIAVLSLQTSLGIEALGAEEGDELQEIWADEMLEVVAASGGRFLALAPGRPRTGFAGICVGASALLDLERARPLLDAAVASECLVFVHPEGTSPPVASQPDWWKWAVDYPNQMQAAYLSWLHSGRNRWPALRIVFAILAGGAPFQLERLTHRGVDVRSSLDPNTYFDVATYGRRAMELLIETFGVHRLVYGSDSPVVDPRPTLDAVRGFGDSVAYVLQTETPTALLT